MHHLAHFGEKDYMCVGGGIAVANSLGYAVTVGDVEWDEKLGAWKAKAELKCGSTGLLIAHAYGYVGDDEDRWVNGPKFARYSMTQTRAEAKLCRANFGHVYVLLGASSDTPAEEMAGLPTHSAPAAAPPARTSSSVDHHQMSALKQAKAKALPSADEVGVFDIVDVSPKHRKDGTPVLSSKNNPCIVVYTACGKRFDTFFPPFKAVAEEAMGSKQQAEISFSTNQYGHDIVDIAVVQSVTESELVVDELPL
jgi:hypothetical protein